MLRNTINFREPTNEDMEFLKSIYNDKTIKEMSLNISDQDIGEMEILNTINFFKSNNLEYFLVLLGDTRIGVAMVYELNKVDDFAFIGMSLAKEYRGMGYGKKVVDLISVKLKDKYNISNISGEVYSNNEQSLKFIEKLGFIKDPTKTKELNIRGTIIKRYIYNKNI